MQRRMAVEIEAAAKFAVRARPVQSKFTITAAVRYALLRRSSIVSAWRQRRASGMNSSSLAPTSRASGDNQSAPNSASVAGIEVDSVPEVLMAARKPRSLRLFHWKPADSA